MGGEGILERVRYIYMLCFLLSGRVDVRIAPWLCGAPLTALLKKQGGIRPIAVEEILCRLTSRLCCSAVKAASQDVFLPYGQVGVGTRGGLEAAIHSLSTIIDLHGNDPDLCCLKVDFQNAFNKCRCSSFLCRLKKESPHFLLGPMVLPLWRTFAFRLPLHQVIRWSTTRWPPWPTLVFFDSPGIVRWCWLHTWSQPSDLVFGWRDYCWSSFGGFFSLRSLVG